MNKAMDKKNLHLIISLSSTLVMVGFVVGLAHSISSGFAGFWGGLPFWIIALTVISMSLYDVWVENSESRKPIENENNSGDH